MKEERSLHANVSEVGRHVPFADPFCVLRFTYSIVFYLHFGRLWGACCIQVDPCSDLPFLFDSHLPGSVRPSVRHVVLHPGNHFCLRIRSDPSAGGTSGDPVVIPDAHR